MFSSQLGGPWNHLATSVAHSIRCECNFNTRRPTKILCPDRWQCRKLTFCSGTRKLSLCYRMAFIAWSYVYCFDTILACDRQMVIQTHDDYRPIRNLSLICKVIERLVKSRLVGHLTSNKLLNPHQSAYCKHHSTETAFWYIHDHLINVIGSHKVSCLCLLDLSAFDTILTTTSWYHASHLGSVFMAFGFHGSVLSLSESYISSRSFLVKCDNCLSSLYSSSCGVPRGFVHGPLLFIMFTTPLITLISSPFLNHRLYAGDTTLLLSSIWRWLKHCPSLKCSIPDLFLDDCQSFNSQLLQERIPAHRTQ